MNKKDSLPPLSALCEAMINVIMNDGDQEIGLKLVRIFYAGAASVAGSLDAIAGFKDDADVGPALDKLREDASSMGAVSFLPPKEAMEFMQETGMEPLLKAALEEPAANINLH